MKVFLIFSGTAKTDEDGLPVYDERIVRTLEKDTTQSADEALVEIYKKITSR